MEVPESVSLSEQERRPVPLVAFLQGGYRRNRGVVQAAPWFWIDRIEGRITSPGLSGVAPPAVAFAEIMTCAFTSRLAS